MPSERMGSSSSVAAVPAAGRETCGSFSAVTSPSWASSPCCTKRLMVSLATDRYPSTSFLVTGLPCSSVNREAIFLRRAECAMPASGMPSTMCFSSGVSSAAGASSAGSDRVGCACPGFETCRYRENGTSATSVVLTSLSRTWPVSPGRRGWPSPVSSVSVVGACCSRPLRRIRISCAKSRYARPSSFCAFTSLLCRPNLGFKLGQGHGF